MKGKQDASGEDGGNVQLTDVKVIMGTPPSSQATGSTSLSGDATPPGSTGNPGSATESNGSDSRPPSYHDEGYDNPGLTVIELDKSAHSNGDKVPSNGDDDTMNVSSDSEDDKISLQYTRHEWVPMKNFAAENRGFADLDVFVRQARLLLDLPETNMEEILDHMLGTLLREEEPLTSVTEAKREIFTHDSAHQLCKTIQGTCNTLAGGVDYDQSWLTVLCTLPSLQKRHVAIARLKHPANLGRTSQEVYFIILVIAPAKQKGTKNALETGRTFSTLFCDMNLRLKLKEIHSTEEFTRVLLEHAQQLAEKQAHPVEKKKSIEGSDNPHVAAMPEEDESTCFFARGLIGDLKRRVHFYGSDFRDGFVGPRTIQKTISTTFFLYFACLLPGIALGMLNDNNTHGAIGVKEVIWSQMIGGLFFALVGGQPMVILLTTAPLALYTKVIYTISDDLGYNFMAMYAWVGLWNGIFLVLYSLFGASRVMAWSTRSTEEIFALFISIAFTVDATKDIYHDFEENYICDEEHTETTSAPLSGDVQNQTSDVMTTVMSILTTGQSVFNVSTTAAVEACEDCPMEKSILYLLLTLGTVWFGLYLFNFTKTPFLNAGKREILADYALPVAVLFMSFFGTYVFKKVKMEPFAYNRGAVFEFASYNDLNVGAIFVACGLGFCLSLLFFMDQNISAAMVASPENKLKKGTAYHWDLMVIALLNVFLTMFGLPMVHGALPHSPLHVKAMADMEDRVDQGHVYQTVMHVRETRITPIFSHILIGLSIFLLPKPLQYIPRPVLDGLFLYLAATALGGNQMFERILLFFTEQAAYPPNHYIRSVPQRKVHLFTFLQIIQLAVMCGIGFSPMPYLKMTFPVLILLLLPIRHKLIPKAIEKKYLKAIDGH